MRRHLLAPIKKIAMQAYRKRLSRSVEPVAGLWGCVKASRPSQRSCSSSPGSRSGPCVRGSPRLTSEQRCGPGGVIVLLRRIARQHFLTASPLALRPDMRMVASLARALWILDVAADPDGPLLTDAAASLLALLAHSNPPCRTKCLRKDPRLDERGEAAAE